jgi:hypothetical protein
MMAFLKEVQLLSEVELLSEYGWRGGEEEFFLWNYKII